MSAPDEIRDEGERLSRDALEALQVERLKRSLTHAYANCAYYRAKCERASIAPEDLRTLTDLARFPFTEKDDFRAGYPFGHFAVPREQVLRIHASSGTTGAATVVGYTRGDLDRWTGLVARSIRAAGGQPGMRVHVAYGYGLFTGGLGAHYGAEALGCAVIPISGGQTERQVQLLVDLSPEIVMATPSYMLAILDEFRRRDIDPTSTRLQAGIFGAEPWSEGMRREIESAFDIDAIDIYGLSEVMGPGVACEYRDDKGALTVFEDHFLAEIIDPATGAPVPAGAPGELVFTSLTKEATPVIRYRTRDLTRFLAGGPRSMRRIARISGRADDMLIIRGVNVFPAQIEEIILSTPGFAPHYEIEVTRPARLDEIEIIVEARTGADAELLARRIKELIGVSAAIRPATEGSLSRSVGKARRVRDLRS